MPKDALELLRSDHRELLQKLDRIAETTTGAEKTRERLCIQIADLVETHTALEEELFYPALEAAAEEEEDEQMMHEAREEHAAADKVLTDLRGSDVTTPEFSGRAKVLKDLLAHHIEEEEEQMFARARELLGQERLVELGEQMKVRREELMSELA